MSLSFYDYHRHSYAHLPLDGTHVAEFLVGDYAADGSVGKKGEFRILLHLFGTFSTYRHLPKPLSVQLCVFDDAHGALREFIALGGLEAIESTPCHGRDDFSRLLLGLGLRDASDTPLPRGAQ